MDTIDHLINLNLEVSKNRYLCSVKSNQQFNQQGFNCVQENIGVVQIDQLQKKIQEIKIQSDKEFDEEQQLLQQLLDSIHRYKQIMINGIDKIIQILIDQIQNIHSSKEKFSQQLEVGIQLNTLDQFYNQREIQGNSRKQVQKQIKQLLSILQSTHVNFDYLNQISTESHDKEENQIDHITSTIQISNEKLKQGPQKIQGKLQYELIKESSNEKYVYCSSMAFNKDNTILALGCDSKIIILKFENGKIGKEIQTLSSHRDYVLCLYFMKQTDFLVSGYYDGSIIIWKKDKTNYWVPLQILKDHKSRVDCLLMNKNENLLITGCEDKTIKFWKKNNNQWKCQQTIKTENCGKALSLNEMENILISCGFFACIYVMEIQTNKQWKIKQMIDVNECGYSICFTFENQFLFQPETKDYIEVYDYDCSTNQFKKQQQVQIQLCGGYEVPFPSKFIKQFNILFIKHGHFMNILKLKEDRSYELIQTIEYENSFLHGTISDDGQYLVTQNQNIYEIQVREFKNSQ